jgi:hypothetical protein
MAALSAPLETELEALRVDLTRLFKHGLPWVDFVSFAEETYDERWGRDFERAMRGYARTAKGGPRTSSFRPSVLFNFMRSRPEEFPDVAELCETYGIERVKVSICSAVGRYLKGKRSLMLVSDNSLGTLYRSGDLK